MRKVVKLLSIKSWAKLLVSMCYRWERDHWQNHVHQRCQLGSFQKNAFPSKSQSHDISINLALTQLFFDAACYLLHTPQDRSWINRVQYQNLIKHFLVLGSAVDDSDLWPYSLVHAQFLWDTIHKDSWFQPLSSLLHFLLTLSQIVDCWSRQ